MIRREWFKLALGAVVGGGKAVAGLVSPGSAPALAVSAESGDLIAGQPYLGSWVNITLRCGCTVRWQTSAVVAMRKDAYRRFAANANLGGVVYPTSGCACIRGYGQLTISREDLGLSTLGLPAAEWLQTAIDSNQ